MYLRPLIDTPRSETQNVPDSRKFFENIFLHRKSHPTFYGRVVVYNVWLDKQEVVIYNDLF